MATQTRPASPPFTPRPLTTKNLNVLDIRPLPFRRDPLEITARRVNARGNHPYKPNSAVSPRSDRAKVTVQGGDHRTPAEGQGFTSGLKPLFTSTSLIKPSSTHQIQSQSKTRTYTPSLPKTPFTIKSIIPIDLEILPTRSPKSRSGARASPRRGKSKSPSGLDRARKKVNCQEAVKRVMGNRGSDTGLIGPVHRRKTGEEEERDPVEDVRVPFVAISAEKARQPSTPASLVGLMKDPAPHAYPQSSAGKYGTYTDTSASSTVAPSLPLHHIQPARSNQRGSFVHRSSGLVRSTFSSRIIRAPRERTPVEGSVGDEPVVSVGRRDGGECFAQGRGLARTIYAVMGKPQVIRSAERDKKDIPMDAAVTLAVHASAPAESRTRAPSLDSKKTQEPEVVHPDEDEDGTGCLRCYLDPTRGPVSTRGYDNADQEYRYLSKELQRVLPGHLPCNRCPTNFGSIDAGRRQGLRNRNGTRQAAHVSPPQRRTEEALRLLDVEAALILTYMDRDQRLLSEFQAGDNKGKYMFLADKEDFSQLMVERALADKGIVEPDRGKGLGSAGVGALGMTVKRKNGIIRQLSKGICGNCGMDEAGAIMWRTDQVVKEQFGLRRKLCNKCGLYKQTNLADRPILHPWTNSIGTPAESACAPTPSGACAELPSAKLDSHPAVMGATKECKQAVVAAISNRDSRRGSIAIVASRSSAAESVAFCGSRDIRRDKRSMQETSCRQQGEETPGHLDDGMAVPAKLPLVVSADKDTPPTYTLQAAHGVSRAIKVNPSFTPLKPNDGSVIYQWCPPGFVHLRNLHFGPGGYREVAIPSPPPPVSSRE